MMDQRRRVESMSRDPSLLQCSINPTGCKKVIPTGINFLGCACISFKKILPKSATNFLFQRAMKAELCPLDYKEL